jgi:hypothetical protein
LWIHCYRAKYEETESSVVREIALHQSQPGTQENAVDMVAMEDEQLGSVAVIRDVIGDLEKAHDAFHKRETDTLNL